MNISTISFPAAVLAEGDGQVGNMNTWVLFLGHKKRTFNLKEHTEGDKLGCFL